MSNQQQNQDQHQRYHLNIGTGKSSTATITILNPTTHNLGTTSLASIAANLAIAPTNVTSPAAVATSALSSTPTATLANNSLTSNTAQPLTATSNAAPPTKKKRSIDKACPSKLLEIIPECQTYHEMFAFERKLDLNINKKTLDIQEALKRPARAKKTLRLFISNLFYTTQDTGEPSWELRIEGRLTEDTRSQKRKFSSFFKNLVIELDRDLYGPSDHLIEWNRTLKTTETDGFHIRRNGDSTVKCKILFQLEHQPKHYRVDRGLAKLIGRRTDTRPAILLALWQYIKNKSLQDQNDREYINNDKYLKNIFDCKRMKYTELPEKLNCLLSPPEPIVINHLIVRGVGETQRSVYDIDVEVEENPKDSSMGVLMMSSSSQQEIQQLDDKICDTLDAIKLTRATFDLLAGFAKDPHQFTNRWLASHSGDLTRNTTVATNDQIATQQQQPQLLQQHQQHQVQQSQNGVQQQNTSNQQQGQYLTPGDSEEERRAEYYYQPWLQEAVCRYFYRKIQEQRGDTLFLSIMDQTPNEYNP